jgi:2-polyprenyl-6-methoxyphenol hydroxylase-like FAD-dependent oxidoreductase
LTSQPRAVVIGAGIGGLAAAAGLHAVGWDVTVCERTPVLESTGAGLAPSQMSRRYAHLKPDAHAKVVESVAAF